MLERIKLAVEFLTGNIGVYASLAVVVLTLSFALIFLIEITVCLFSQRKKDTVYYLCYNLLNVVVTAYFAIEDYFGKKLLFETPKSVYTVMTVIISLSIIFYMMVCSLARRDKGKKSREKAVDFIEKENDKQIEVSIVKPKPYEHYFKGELYTGYLNVSHVKNLIYELKQKELSESDYRQIEELELYLMNFISRQPTDGERAVLSEKLSMLIKKIALYAS